MTKYTLEDIELIRGALCWGDDGSHVYVKAREALSRLEQPQVANDEALDIVEEWMRGLSAKAIVLMENPEAYKELTLEAAKLETIRLTLTNAQPKTVDVEEWTSKTERHVETGIHAAHCRLYDDGYNQCLDDLIQEGVINAK